MMTLSLPIMMTMRWGQCWVVFWWTQLVDLVCWGIMHVFLPTLIHSIVLIFLRWWRGCSCVLSHQILSWYPMVFWWLSRSELSHLWSVHLPASEQPPSLPWIIFPCPRGILPPPHLFPSWFTLGIVLLSSHCRDPVWILPFSPERSPWG